MEKQFHLLSRAIFLLFFLFVTCATAQISTTTTLSASPNPVNVDLPVTIKATVAPARPGGRITFYDRATIIGTAPIDGSGQASLTTIALLPGGHQLRAQFQGLPGFSASRSAYLAQTIWSSRVSSLIVGTQFVNFRDNGPRNLLAGDYNQDGRPDVVVGHPDGIQIYFGDGKGNFSPSTITNAKSDFGGFAIASGDFRGIGLMDIVTGNAGSVQFYWNQGDGGFVPGTVIPTTSTVVDMKVADFNRDGNADVVFVNGETGIEVAFGNGDGTFQKSKAYLLQVPVRSLSP